MIIFLDFDGVLNSLSWYKRRENKKHTTRLEYRLHEFDPAAISLLNDLCKDIGAKVVISSTWRIDGLDACRNYLNLAGATFETIGVTEQSQHRHRGLEIEKWLTDNKPSGFFEYVIIDDDDDILPSQYVNFFQTKFEVGLTEEICDRIRALHSMTADSDTYSNSGVPSGGEKFGSDEIHQSASIITAAHALFGHTKPLDGRAREILSEVMFADASDTPDMEGML